MDSTDPATPHSTTPQDPSSPSTSLTIHSSANAASSTALQHSSLYPHIPKRPRARSPKVLEEDTYVEAVSDIIERDFFPNLKKLKTQNEFLDAVAKGELGKAGTLGMELRRMATERVARGAFTPRRQREPTPGNETPSSFPSTSYTTDTPSSIPDPDLTKNLSLDAFQSKYTSEDNASFSKILHKNNTENRSRYNWVFDKTSSQLTLSAPTPEPSLLITDGSDRPNVINHWKHNPLNHLMYVPAEDYTPTTPSESSTRGPPKSITHNATSLPSTTKTSEILQAQHTKDRLRTAEVWQNLAAATPALFPNTSEEEDGQPKVAGYSFVAATPSPAPHRDINPDEVMTWGFIEGTPLLVDSGTEAGEGGGDGGGPKFSMPETPRREVVGIRMAERAGRNMRERSRISSGGVGGGVTPRVGVGNRMASPAVRSSMLSPAGQKLLGLSKCAGSGSTLNAQLRATYSGNTPRHHRSSATPSRFGSVTPSHTPSAPTPSPLVRLNSGRVDRESTVGPEDLGDRTPRMVGRPEFADEAERSRRRSVSVSSGGGGVGRKGGSLTDGLLHI
ncbi:hypothetical protein HK097_001218 [Rhizophlyctis rosea]|uniref:Protein DGCR14 n=1 Tax=Rhizophlyctis rosea TaxID=64517 RepID=A0AAD5S4L9_9FUNG|nr:hypothetical protein HK097_001218 [Rhizophlyctis rosea]